MYRIHPLVWIHKEHPVSWQSYYAVRFVDDQFITRMEICDTLQEARNMARRIRRQLNNSNNRETEQ